MDPAKHLFFGTAYFAFKMQPSILQQQNAIKC